MSEWTNYLKNKPQQMRPYIPGEDMTNITVGEGDIPELGGMVCKNSDDENDLWYISKKFFQNNYLKAGG